MTFTLFEGSHFSSIKWNREVVRSASSCLLTLCLSTAGALPMVSHAAQGASAEVQADTMALLVNIQQAARELEERSISLLLNVH